MAVRTMDEILESVNEILGDNTDDNALTFLEDLTDTITDLEDRANGEANGDGTDWESMYRENDAAWRKKYKERFYSNEPEPKEPEPKQEPEPEPEPPKKFEDLFTTE